MENNLKKLPPLERKPDGSLHRMTPAQRKRANALIRRECCNYDSGNCIVLDDGDTCICPQTISFSVIKCQDLMYKKYYIKMYN